MYDSNFKYDKTCTGETDKHKIKLISVVFLGSPLIDLTANIDDDFLRKYNIDIDNTYWITEENCGIFEQIKKFDVNIEIGGTIVNTARIFQKLNAHANVIFLGATGKDDYGEYVKTVFRKEGIQFYLGEIENEETGKVAVLLKGKGRTLVTNLGASKLFSVQHLKQESVWDQVKNASYIYFSALFIGVSFEVIKTVIEENISNGRKTTIAFNLGAPFLSVKYKKEMRYLYSNSNLVFGNEVEHQAFVNSCNIDTNTDICKTDKFRLVIITRGDKSVKVIRNNSDVEEFQVAKIDNVVDTNGAGDAFVGGFLASYVEGRSIADCVKHGIWVSRKVIQSFGFNCNFQDDFQNSD